MIENCGFVTLLQRHDIFFPTFGISLAQTSLRRQLLKVLNIRNEIHCSEQKKGGGGTQGRFTPYCQVCISRNGDQVCRAYGGFHFLCSFFLEKIKLPACPILFKLSGEHCYGLINFIPHCMKEILGAKKRNGFFEHLALYATLFRSVRV